MGTAFLPCYYKICSAHKVYETITHLFALHVLLGNKSTSSRTSKGLHMQC